MKIGLLIVLLLAAAQATPPAQTELTITAVNKLKLARANETIELTLKDLAPLAEKDLTRLHVRDSSGKELLAQSVDSDYDDYHKPDLLIFQSDFAAGQTKTFTVFAGAKSEYTKDDFRAYGRFVRERFDDFAWENDRIAHRTYGQALITWKGEPLTSSAIDIWSKRTPKMVINDWYMVDNYHADHGEGVDAYSAGPTRGCGASGIWANDQLYIPRNFVDSHVLANGPIRVMFELFYPSINVNGDLVSQVLRVSLDGGSQLNRFDTFYRRGGSTGPLAVAIGLKKVKDAQKDFNAEQGRLTIWEPMDKNLGMQGLAVIVNPRDVDKVVEDKLNHLLVLNPTMNTMPISYWAGFAWDRAGKITSAQAWNKYVDEFAEARRSPIAITVK
jgi:pectinesterase